MAAGPSSGAPIADARDPTGADAPLPQPSRGWRSWLERFTPRKRLGPRRAPDAAEITAPSRKQRWRKVLLWVVLALLAYPVLGTLALWTGLVEWALRSDDLRVEIANPAYTIWPGRVRGAHVRVLANGETQFILEGRDLVVNVRMLELITRRVHVTELAAHDVRYEMRVQLEEGQGRPERIAAFPPLKDLPGANTVRKNPAEKAKGAWTVEVEGLDVRVKELWFLEYRFLGDGRLRGGFTVGPEVMSVTTAVRELGPGDLRFGAEQVIAKNLRGQIDATIPEVNPNEHADIGFVELVDARVNLRADVQSLAHVGAYLDGLTVHGGAGPLALDLYLDKGQLGPKSRLDFPTGSVGVKGQGFGVQGDLRLDFDAAGERNKGESAGLPLLRASSKSTYVSLAEGNREFTVQIHGHHEEVALDTIQLSRSTPLRRASIRMPTIVSVDLDDLGAVLSEETPLEVRGGEARASLSLDMDQDYWLRGPVSCVLQGTQVDVGGVAIDADTTFKARVAMNPKLKTNVLENATLSLRNVNVRAGDESVTNWWLDLSAKRLTLWSTKPARLEGSVSIRARDLEPVLESLAEKDKLSDLIPMFTSLDDFRAKVTVRQQAPATDITLESESDVWDASGRIYTNGKQQRMAVVVGGQAVSLGIATAGDDLEIAPFAKTEWLNSRLRAFPKPLVQLPANKP